MDQISVEEKIQEITKKIVEGFQPDKIILFGSYAWGHPTSDSDVDLLVVKNSTKSKSEREDELRRFLFPAGLPLDILVYTPSELKEKIEYDRNLFLEDIVNNGKVLYANNEIRKGLAHSS